MSEPLRKQRTLATAAAVRQVVAYTVKRRANRRPVTLFMTSPCTWCDFRRASKSAGPDGDG